MLKLSKNAPKLQKEWDQISFPIVPCFHKRIQPLTFALCLSNLVLCVHNQNSLSITLTYMSIQFCNLKDEYKRLMFWSVYIYVCFVLSTRLSVYLSLYLPYMNIQPIVEVSCCMYIYLFNLTSLSSYLDNSLTICIDLNSFYSSEDCSFKHVILYQIKEKDKNTNNVIQFQGNKV